MNKSIYFILFLFSTQLLLASPNIITLNQNWQFSEAEKEEWLPISIPGSAHTGLMENGKIEDPFYRDNEKKLQWIGEKDWEFKTTFKVDQRLLAQDHIELNFKGLDTYADVFLNGKKILIADNMFRSWVVDCKQYLQEGANEMRIYFHSPDQVSKKAFADLGYELPGGHRVMARKAQFHFGWDWGPRFVTTGIWQDIELKAWSKAAIEDFHLEYKIKDGVVFGTAHFIIASSKAQKASLNFNIEKKNYHAHINLTQNKNNKAAITFKIDNPRLWWTKNMGEPYLYFTTAILRINERPIDRKEMKIGFRDLKLITKKDKQGSQFYFELNGEPVFMKGANYIPQDIFHTQTTDEDYKNLFKQIGLANMNMLRVWGGGIYEKDIFYELCDINGILVWQDFMYACAMYPGDEKFKANIEAESIEQIKRLRKHPCIGLWCGNNENSEGWHRWGWQDAFDAKQKKKIWKDYKNLFQKQLPNLVKHLDQKTAYWESSPMLGRGDPKHQFQGDSHYWGIWHDAEPFENFENKVPRFMSEFGFQSYPNYKTLESVTLEEDRSPDSEVMLVHQKHPRGNPLIREYMERDYKVPEKFEHFVYVSQLLQAEGMRTGIEAHRAAKPYCLGTLYWQLNDCWPVVSWSSIDYHGRWKAMHYYVADDYKNVMLAANIKGDSINVAVVSDELNKIEVDVYVNQMSFDGEKIDQSKMDITVPANGVKKLYFPLKIKDTQRKSSLVYLQVIKSGKLMSDKVLLPLVPKDMDLSKVVLKPSVKKRMNSYRITFDPEKYAKGVYLDIDAKGHFSDNFFDLIPGYGKVVDFVTEEIIEDFESRLKVMSLRDTY